MKSFLIVFALIAITSCNFLGGYDALQSQLEHLDSTEFGKNLLDTIALQIKSESPMSDISALIRDMMTDLQKQQQEADTAAAVKAAECKASIATLDGRITHANNEIGDATLAIRTLRQRRSDLLKDISTGEATLVALDDQEQMARENQAHNIETFFERHEETKLVLEALDVVIPKLKQITPHTASEVFMELAKLGDDNPIAALVQVASGLNPDALAKCISMLEQLQADFAYFLENDVQVQIDETVEFDNLMIQIALTRKLTKQKLADDKSELENVESTLEQQRSRLRAGEEELGAAQEAKRLKKAECAAYEAAYQRDTNQRNEELGILEQVAQIVASKLPGLDNFLDGR